VYQHPLSICSLVLCREIDGEEVLFSPQIRNPEQQPLIELQEAITGYVSRPVWEVGTFRRQMRFNRLPRFLRRLLMWWCLNVNGEKRAHHMGTFALSSVAGEGAITPNAYSPLTSLLTYGPIDDKGQCQVTIVYDHRITDGRTIARCLAELERTLTSTIVDELESLNQNRSAA
jgi:hypothetical protein